MSVSALNKITNNVIYCDSLTVANQADYRFLGASFDIPFSQVTAYPSTLQITPGQQALSQVCTIPSLTTDNIIEVIINFSVQLDEPFVSNTDMFEYFFEYQLNDSGWNFLPAPWDNFRQFWSYDNEIKNIHMSFNIDENFLSSSKFDLRMVVQAVDNTILVGESGTTFLIRNFTKAP
jgi:hypothetical protein